MRSPLAQRGRWGLHQVLAESLPDNVPGAAIPIVHRVIEVHDECVVAHASPLTAKAARGRRLAAVHTRRNLVWRAGAVDPCVCVRRSDLTLQ